MSGGSFEYTQYQIRNIVKELSTLDDDYLEIMDEQMKRDLIKTTRMLEEAEIRMHRLDWYLAGDDGKETYHKRLNEDLAEKGFK